VRLSVQLLKGIFMDPYLVCIAFHINPSDNKFH
jgi:hypothetical protein